MPNDLVNQWPAYFAAVDIPGRHPITAGHAFPIQRKETIRGYGAAVGVSDAAMRPFGELPYVRILNVLSIEHARHIQEQDLDFDTAHALVAPQGGGELNAKPAAKSKRAA